MIYLDTCVISNLVKPTSDRPQIHDSDLIAMCDLALEHEYDDFVMSPQAKKEFEQDKNLYRQKLKSEIYEWLEHVSTPSKNLLLIPVWSQDGRKPMLPLHDPFDPPRPKGTPVKLPKGVKIPHNRLIGHDIMFTDRELLRKLEQVFDPPDAEHIYQAIQGGCRYFVTLDKKSILDRIEPNQALLDTICNGMEFLPPSDLLVKQSD